VISHISIGKRRIGLNEPVYIVAEISANHNQDFEQAARLLQAAKDAGADAVKFQTYTPDTMTIRSDRKHFRIDGSLWDGWTLYDLYAKAYTPWEWQPKLKEMAEKIGLDFLSTPFDPMSVDFLDRMGVTAYKVASFEIVDLPLIEVLANTGKPLIISTGMATLGEIEDAVQAAQKGGTREIALLKCTSAYPAPPEEANLRTIPHLAEAFGLPVGLSDHTLGIAVPVAGVALGACIVEKHFTLSRSNPGPDSAFSLEPPEFKAMVEAIRTTEKALGKVYYGVSEKEESSKVFRRSLFVVRDMRAGEVFTKENVRSIRPGYGLPPKFLKDVLGRRVARDVTCGTPLSWELIGERLD
jgi:N-acetylneuraminate synthase